MLWYYEFANGEYVSLSTMGLKDAVYSEIASNIIQKLANKIDSDIQKTVKMLHEIQEIQVSTRILVWGIILVSNH